MIVGFSKYGTGKGRGPVNYLTDPHRPGRENQPPKVVRGNAENTGKLIDSLSFKWKYTSGVLSFAPDENSTPEKENTIMDRFEAVAFAGLQPDQYNILWVRHTHAGHHELHFVTPRVELTSGKSLNIRPPGQKTQQHFDDFRSEINAQYGLSDPTDPGRAKNVSIPDHELKISAEALRDRQNAIKNIRHTLDDILTQRALQGLIRSRSDIVDQITDLNLTVVREGKDYITVCNPQDDKRWRMKGTLYARNYEPGRTIGRAAAARERDYSKPDREAAKHYAARVEEHIAARAAYHQERYSTPERTLGMVNLQKSDLLANHHRPEPLYRFIGRQLGNDALLNPKHSGTGKHPDNTRADQSRDELIEEGAKINFSQCDNRLCAEINTKAPTYGEKGQYRILKGY